MNETNNPYASPTDTTLSVKGVAADVSWMACNDIA